MRNMPLKPIEQDFHSLFKLWQLDSETCEAVIVLRFDRYLDAAKESTEVLK